MFAAWYGLQLPGTLARHPSRPEAKNQRDEPDPQIGGDPDRCRCHRLTLQSRRGGTDHNQGNRKASPRKYRRPLAMAEHRAQTEGDSHALADPRRGYQQAQRDRTRQGTAFRHRQTQQPPVEGARVTSPAAWREASSLRSLSVSGHGNPLTAVRVTAIY